MSCQHLSAVECDEPMCVDRKYEWLEIVGANGIKWRAPSVFGGTRIRLWRSRREGRTGHEGYRSWWGEGCELRSLLGS